MSSLWGMQIFKKPIMHKIFTLMDLPCYLQKIVKDTVLSIVLTILM